MKGKIFYIIILKENLHHDMKKLSRRDKNWDIKIADYIKENYKRIPLFIDPDHPLKYLMQEIGRRTARILNINDIDENLNYEPCLGISVPIIPCVMDFYGLNFIVPCEKMHCLLKLNSGYGLKEYIRIYLWWYHEKIL